MSVSGDDLGFPLQPIPAPAKLSRLDAAMAQLQDIPRAAWWRAAWLTVVGTAAILVVTEGGVALWAHAAQHPLGHIVRDVIGLVGEVGFLMLALFASRGVRDRAGNWDAALGWARPRLRDLGWGALWLIVQGIAAAALRQVLTLVASAATLHAATNVHHEHYPGALRLTLGLFTSMVVAPIAEETQCRGVLLRAGMSRWTFTRAALLSSLFFGALHANQASSAAGGVFLAIQIAMFGFLQCLLVRITGRLAPGAVTHGLTNGIATLAALTG